MTRIVLHADLDAFFAAVEQQDSPELRGRPVLVGRAAEQRGVVAAASYEARRFGVHSAMPMRRALRLCPEAVRVDPRFDRYAEVSRTIMDIYRSITPLVEPLSLDEAFLEVTDLVHDFGDAAVLAKRIKKEVKSKTGLTVSIGVATSKSVAKIATDKGKPDGLVVVQPGDESAFIAPLNVETISGIGPKTADALELLGVETIGHLAAADSDALIEVLGSRTAYFKRLAQGLDEQPLFLAHERKSLGAERTFPRDLSDGPALRAELHSLTVEVAQRLADADAKAQLIVLKLRYGNFRTITRQRSLAVPAATAGELEQVALALLSENVEPADRFRLIGLRCARLSAASAR
jgi:DNA polymerase-4